MRYRMLRAAVSAPSLIHPINIGRVPLCARPVPCTRSTMDYVACSGKEGRSFLSSRSLQFHGEARTTTKGQRDMWNYKMWERAWKWAQMLEYVRGWGRGKWEIAVQCVQSFSCTRWVSGRDLLYCSVPVGSKTVLCTETFGKRVDLMLSILAQ